MELALRYVGKVVALLLESEAHVATKYIDPKLVVRATRNTLHGKIDKRQGIDIRLTIGKPNFEARKFIKGCKDAGEPFPVKKIQLKYPPKKKGSK